MHLQMKLRDICSPSALIKNNMEEKHLLLLTVNKIPKMLPNYNKNRMTQIQTRTKINATDCSVYCKKKKIEDTSAAYHKNLTKC